MIWTQWSDLKIPDGLQHLATNGVTPDATDLAKITFYVPAYMYGAAALTPIKDMSSLKVIQSPNAGVDDVIPLLPKGVTLCNAAGVHDASTAELALGLAIASRRGFYEFAQNQSKGQWLHTSNASLTDSKVAIVGYGNIGKTIARMLEGFDIDVTSFSRSGKDGALTMENFDHLLPTFDVIILIVPLNDQTRHFMSAKRLSTMKDGASLINVARGAIIDTDALVSELNSGRISCALDVTDPEPLPDGHPLWNVSNCLITPHTADTPAQVTRMLAERISVNVKAFCTDGVMVGLVDKELGY